jgi:hypothetical protein
MPNCDLCFTYGVQTVSTKVNDREAEVCFECIEGEEQ